jgi:hypothetical protein
MSHTTPTDTTDPVASPEAELAGLLWLDPETGEELLVEASGCEAFLRGLLRHGLVRAAVGGSEGAPRRRARLAVLSGGAPAALGRRGA